MRNAILTIAAVLTLVAGPVRADSPKPLPADVGPGRVAWFDITTTDIAKAKEFYGKLFDWKFTAVKGTDMAAEIVSRGTSIGTIRVGEGQISPYNGVVYVQVADLTGSCNKVKELGGTLIPGFPFNLPDGIGAIGLITDPSGHPIGMYSRTPLPVAKPAK